MTPDRSALEAVLAEYDEINDRSNRDDPEWDFVMRAADYRVLRGALRAEHGSGEPVAHGTSPVNLAFELGYLRGEIEGIRSYAVWGNGEQFVGVMRKPLYQVIQPLIDKANATRAQLYAIQAFEEPTSK